MELLNTMCYGSAFLITGVVLVLVVACFCTSLYSCFTKKIKGNIIVKVLVTIFFGCSCPMLIRLMLYFVSKMNLQF